MRNPSGETISASPKHSNRIEINRAALYLIGASVIYFLIYWHRLLLQSMMPFDGNTLRLFYPSWVVGKKLLIDGFHLLWDPYRNMGQPFLADPQNQALYPIRFLSPFLNLLDYQRIFVVSHGLLASCCAFLLAKRLFKENSAALFAGLVFGFNGLFLARVTVPAHFATMAWLPAVLLLLNLRKPILLGVALTLQWMAGFPPFFILTYIALLIISFASDQRRDTLVCLIKGSFVMLGLAAIQWIPFLEMLKESSRPVLLSANQAIEYSLHPMELVRQIFMPSFILTFLKPVTDSDQAIISFYFGVVSLLLFIWGVLRGGRRERVFLGAAVLAFVMALGQYNKFYRFIPFVTIFRFPAQWILLATIAFAFVGAYGLVCIRNKKLRWGVFVLAALDMLVYALPMHTAWGNLEFFSQTPRLQGLDRIPDGSRIFHSPVIIGRVHLWKIDSMEDWLFLKEGLVPSIGVAYGVKETASYSILKSKRHLAFLDRLNHSPISSPLFDYAGISKIVSLTKEGISKPIPERKDCRVIENPDFKPKVFMHSPGGKDLLRIQIVKDRPGNIIVQAQGPGKLVVSEAYYPGWRVTVDGKASNARIFEDAFVSVDLSPGSHRVRFYYYPFSFLLGLIISLLTGSMILLSKFNIYSRLFGRHRRQRPS